MKTILVDACDTLVLDDIGIFQDMKTLLDSYSNRKIILTNANDEQLVSFGLVNMPYEMFTLKHNPDKIDPVYFETMFQKYNFTKDDIIYFEHNEAAVQSAMSLGILSYHYDKDKKDLVALKEFIDNNL